MIKVFIDAGHGGKDPGATGNRLQEKDIALSVTKKVGTILEQYNIETHYSRTSDVYLTLSERTNKANSLKADVVISIHVNSATNTSARGIETFHYPRSKEGKKMAEYVQNSLVKSKIFTNDRGVKTANFHVIRETSMPAILIELGFISNSQDAQILRAKQNDMANAIAEGLLDYLKTKFAVSKMQPTKETVKLSILGKKIIANGYFKNNTNYIKIGNRDVPVRDLGQALNLNVSWDNKNKVVIMK